MEKLFRALPFALGAGFLFFGAQKFGASNLVFEVIAERSGIGVFEPLIRRMTGVSEIVAGLMLITPFARKEGAFLGLAILLGAIAFHLSPWLGINVPGIGHGLFMSALLMTAINALLVRHYLRSAKPYDIQIRTA